MINWIKKIYAYRDRSINEIKQEKHKVMDEVVQNIHKQFGPVAIGRIAHKVTRAVVNENLGKRFNIYSGTIDPANIQERLEEIAHYEVEKILDRARDQLIYQMEQFYQEHEGELMDRLVASLKRKQLQDHQS